MAVSRRHLIMLGIAAPAAALGAAAVLVPRFQTAPQRPQAIEIAWDDLIPPGVPYSEIIGEGEMDVANDTWRPIYDANGTKLNEVLNGAFVRMPGYMIPMEMGSDGVRTFILVPYVGACIHTPPPPANQLVLVTSENPWPSDQLWDPVWVTGEMRTELQSTEVADTGYSLAAAEIEVYEW